MIDFRSSETWLRDPKHVVFTFARYKFVAKMLAGIAEVAEIGSGDGIAAQIVAQHVGDLLKTDLKGMNDVVEHDILKEPLHRTFDAIYSLDVLEHIFDEDAYMRNICDSLRPYGIFVIGLPSLESQLYACDLSKADHINCKTEQGLRDLLKKYFRSVFLFGMNDETLHTGYGAMCHYRLAIATCKR